MKDFHGGEVIFDIDQDKVIFIQRPLGYRNERIYRITIDMDSNRRRVSRQSCSAQFGISDPQDARIRDSEEYRAVSAPVCRQHCGAV